MYRMYCTSVIPVAPVRFRQDRVRETKTTAIVIPHVTPLIDVCLALRLHILPSETYGLQAPFTGTTSSDGGLLLVVVPSRRLYVLSLKGSSMPHVLTLKSFPCNAHHPIMRKLLLAADSDDALPPNRASTASVVDSSASAWLAQCGLSPLSIQPRGKIASVPDPEVADLETEIASSMPLRSRQDKVLSPASREITLLDSSSAVYLAGKYSTRTIIAWALKHAYLDDGESQDSSTGTRAATYKLQQAVTDTITSYLASRPSCTV